MAFDKSKFLKRFVEDSREQVEILYDGLFSLEKNVQDVEMLNSIFRSAHTIKGSSRMMKLTAISETAHKIEDVLDALRGKKIPYSKDLSDLLFKGIDTVAEMVEKAGAGEEATTVDEALCETLERVARGELAVDSPEASSPSDPHKAPKVAVAEKEIPSKSEPTLGIPKMKAFESIRINADKLDGLINLVGEIVSNNARFKQRLMDIRATDIIAKNSADLIAPLENGNHTHSFQLKLKQLASSFREDLNLQELLSGELQESALKMRMLPLATVFSTLPRTVRDISKVMGKDIELVLEGNETELDKKVIENIGDPLIHMIRNSIDHGIEAPEERVKQGKPERGIVRISAYNEGGDVVIEVSDDGSGLSIEKIKAKALRKKILDEETLNTMPEAEIIDLIFNPGFSTSEIITDVSGRGVGMDVVRKNLVENLKGSIQIENRPGQGTTFYVRLPLTLAILRVLLVTVAETMFAIPINYVKEILTIPLKEVIHILDKGAINLREEIIPIANLVDLLKLPGSASKKDQDLLIILTRVGDEKLGLVVDTLLDEEDMVVKPLPLHMKDINLVSGVVITGDNTVVNVLNVPGLWKVTKEVHVPKSVKETVANKIQMANILVVDDSVSTREIEKSILEAKGYQVDLAGDGIEAFEKAKASEYDLIITDIEMPRMDGFSLTKQLRKDDLYKDIPVIIVTSREKEEDKRRGVEVGADAYIIKGAFDQSRLVETVQNLVG